tara:strand:+ start:1535 stop:2344 length:810 start_codon:yes stop_codon:yes gene_type:complete
MNNNGIKLFSVLLLIILQSCSAPGVKSPKSTVGFSGDTFYFDNGNILDVENIEIRNLSKVNLPYEEYVVASGDKINVTVWGLNEAFPALSFNIKDNPLTTRTVRSDGTIFFPYVGLLTVANFSIDEVRRMISDKLQESFVDPQVDVTVVEFNDTRTVYVVGEIKNSVSFKIGIEPISLMDAIGRARGLNPYTSDPKEVYIFRSINDEPRILKIDLSTADKFLLAHRVDLQPQDVIYVGRSNLTEWNSIVTQLFPFSSFLNTLDQIQARD